MFLQTKPLQITSAQALGGTCVRVQFSDGREAQIDLKPLLTGPMFDCLRDPALFACFQLDEDLGTLVWANGADLAPEALYFLAFHQDPALQELFRTWGYGTQR